MTSKIRVVQHWGLRLLLKGRISQHELGLAVRHLESILPALCAFCIDRKDSLLQAEKNNARP